MVGAFLLQFFITATVHELHNAIVHSYAVITQGILRNGFENMKCRIQHYLQTNGQDFLNQFYIFYVLLKVHRSQLRYSQDFPLQISQGFCIAW